MELLAEQSVSIKTQLISLISVNLLRIRNSLTRVLHQTEHLINPFDSNYIEEYFQSSTDDKHHFPTASNMIIPCVYLMTSENACR